MNFTYESIDEVLGFPISECSMFDVGTVLLIDGTAWELVETCGDQLFFAPSDELEQAKENNEFFYDYCA